MNQYIVLAVIGVASIGFLLYVIFSLEREVRRERRDRLKTRIQISLQSSRDSISNLDHDNEPETNAFDKYKTHAIKPVERELPSIGFDLQPRRKSSAGGSR